MFRLVFWLPLMFIACTEFKPEDNNLIPNVTFGQFVEHPDNGFYSFIPTKKLTALPHFSGIKTNSLTKSDVFDLKDIVGLDLTTDATGSEVVDYLKTAEKLKYLKISGESIDKIDLEKLKHLKNLTHIDLSGTRINDSSIENLNILFPKLEYLNLSSRKGVTDKSLESIGKLDQLIYLNLFSCDISSEIFRKTIKLTNLRFLLLGETTITDIKTGEIDQFSKLTYLNLSRTKICDDTLKELVKLKKLQHLVISETHVKGENFGLFSKLTHLTSLSLGESQITKKSIELLQKTSISSLEISYLPITTEWFDELALLPSLHELTIFSLQLTDKEMVGVEKLKALKKLYISAPKISNKSCVSIGKIENLRELRLSDTQIDSKGVAELAKLIHLTHFDLSRSQVDDDASKHFLNFKKLHTLNLTHSKITNVFFEGWNKMNIVNLNISNTQIKPEVASLLAKVNCIEDIDLSNTSIEDGDLAKLLKLPQLSRVNLFGTKTTKEGREKAMKETKFRVLFEN